MKRFGSDPQLQKYAEWFIPVKLDIASEQWKAFRKVYRHDGGIVPIVFIVRADGEKLYGSGKRISAQQLYSIVEDSISKSGRTYTIPQAAALTAAAESASSQLDDGDLEGAIKSIMSVKKIGMPGQLNSFATGAIAADAVAVRIEAQIGPQIEAIKTGLGDEKTAPEAAINMVAALRKFTRWLPRKDDLKQLKRQFKDDPKLDALLEQAFLFDSMREAQQQENFTKLLAEYRKLVENYADGEITPRGEALLKSAITPEQAKADDFFVAWQSATGFRTTGVLKSFVKDDAGGLKSISIVDRRDKTIEVPLDKLDLVSQQLAAAIAAQR